MTRRASFTVSHRSRNRWLTWKKWDTASNTCMYTESLTTRGCCSCHKFTWIQTRPIHGSKLHQKLLNTNITISCSGNYYPVYLWKLKEFVKEKTNSSILFHLPFSTVGTGYWAVSCCEVQQFLCFWSKTWFPSTQLLFSLFPAVPIAPQFFHLSSHIFCFLYYLCYFLLSLGHLQRVACLTTKKIFYLET